MALKPVVDPIAAWIRHRGVRVYRRLKNMGRSLSLTTELAHWEARREEIIATGRRRPRSSISALGLTPPQIGTLEVRARSSGTAVVAKIDQDGYWQANVGPIREVPLINDATFLKRTKSDVHVVWSAEYFGIRKHYRGNHVAFLNELCALDRLGRLGMRVPAILDIDFQGPSLVVSYLPGRVLREALVRAGAIIRDRDHGPWSKRKRGVDVVIKAGGMLLPHVVSTEFIAEMENDLRRFHDAGLMILDIKWGNVVIGYDGLPWWLDFDMTEDHSDLSRENFEVLASLDVQRFNKFFGTTYQAPPMRQCA